MRYFGLAMMALALAGCVSGPKPPENPAVTLLEGVNELPPPTGYGPGPVRGSSRVGPLDVLSFEVFGIEELKQEKLQVGPGGWVSFPLVGPLNADGMSIEDLERAVAVGLKDAGVRDPRVTINFVDVQSQYVTVEGEVKKPGLVQVRREMTLLRALAAAEGLTETARQKNVVVFRTVDGRKMAALYNLGAIRMGYYDDPALYADDVVVVNQDRAAVLFQQVVNVLPALTYVVVGLIN